MLTTMGGSDIEHRSVRTNGVTLHVALAGPEDGAPVILLHGFPEAWHGWRKQIAALAAAGFRVIAPDQRGYGSRYGASDKPAGIDAYNIDTLAADIMGLIDTLCSGKAAVVGHDWGGLVAWWLALKSPQRLTRLGILNAPHPAVAVPQALRHPSQFLRSLYILFFQLPRLPEWALGRNHFNGLINLLRASSRPGTFSDAEIAEYVESWSQPGALTGMLNWYRAMRRALGQRPTRIRRNARITTPALILWGARDVALGRYLAPASLELCDRGRLAFFEQASHWVQHEEPDQVNAMLIDFLRSSPTT